MSDSNYPRHVNIFVAWPSDVKDERNKAEAVIKELSTVYHSQNYFLEMRDWTKNVSAGAGNPEDHILKTTRPKEWDVFIGILWSRFGQPPYDKPNVRNPRTTQPYESGFEYEYDVAFDLWVKNNGRPQIMIYLCDRPVPKNQINQRQLDLVDEFVKRIENQKEVMYKKYKSANDFGMKLKKDLPIIIQQIMERDAAARVQKPVQFTLRDYELTRVHKIISAHPETSIMIFAPPGLGKSWLLERLLLSLHEPGDFSPTLYCVEIDCRASLGIPGSIRELLLYLYKQLLPAESDLETVSELIQAIAYKAGTLTSEQKRLIFLFDHIEFLQEGCRAFLRDTFIPELRRVVGRSEFYPALVAFGRFCPAEWSGEGAVRFETIELLPYHTSTIEKLLRQKTEELKLQPFSDAMYADWAEKVFKVSHGHPHCVANLLAGFYHEPYTKSNGLLSKNTFMKFIDPIIKDNILSDDNLAPFEPIHKRTEIAGRLKKVLPYLCIFRFYSFAQLRLLAHSGVIRFDEVEELAECLSRTFLVELPDQQPWCRPYDIIRWLLFDEVYYLEKDTLDRINQSVCACYDAWITGNGPQELMNLADGVLQGHEQIRYIIESLYHHSLADQGENLVANLKSILENYLNHIRSNYPKKHSIEMLVRCMRADSELAQIVRAPDKADESEIKDDYQTLLAVVEKEMQNF